MKIGILKEIKKHEYRVGLLPNGVKALVDDGHLVFAEQKCGVESGFTNQEYIDAGAQITDKDTIFNDADFIIKVKEPLENEYSKLKPGQVLFTYLHLAPDPKQTKGLLDSDAVAIAYETITDDFGGLPLLRPMSEIAGRMSIQAGASSLEKECGGSGVLLSGVIGVDPGKVLVLGAGVAGINAAKIAVGIGAEVTIMDISLTRLSKIENEFATKVRTRLSSKYDLIEMLAKADLVIGAALLPGSAAPKLITKEMLKNMSKGSVIVDISIDQGGIAETSLATTHDDPTFIVNDIVHYCVANMPGAVARTSTIALTNATLPYVLDIANKGYKNAILEDRHLKAGLNVYRGTLTNQAVAESLKIKYTEFKA